VTFTYSIPGIKYMATKYLKHLNQFPATYLRDLAGNPSVEVKPGEMLLYTDIVNSDINSVNYNLNLWTDYIEKNNFTIVTILDPAPPVIANTFLFYRITMTYAGNDRVADGTYPFRDYSPTGSSFADISGPAPFNGEYPTYYNIEFLISVDQPQSLTYKDGLGPHIIPASEFIYSEAGNLLVTKIYAPNTWTDFNLNLSDGTVLSCTATPPLM
jgi:hypothetical protein